MVRTSLVAVGVVLLSSCASDASLSVRVPVSVTVGDRIAACGDIYELGTEGTSVQLSDARFFLSEVAFRNFEGDWLTLSLDDTIWQGNGIVLIDAEDGTGLCSDSGTSETNLSINGILPSGDFTAVRFTLGVPFELNHADQATAEAPLTVPGMFWTWQGGYKFLRTDWVREDDGGRWNAHIGSSGCASDAPTVAPESCTWPNRATITVDDFQLGTDTLVLDLAELFGGADLTADTEGSAPGCMSTPNDEAECTPLWESLGMSWSTGACVADCEDQVAFERQTP